MISNSQVIIIKDEQQLQSVVEFMLEYNISFQSGFEDVEQAQYVADEIAYESSNEEWNSSGCEYDYE